MIELLFENIKEKEALENLLALNQIKKCDKEIDKYSNEINKLNEEMESILKNENIDETYVDKIHKYKKLLSKMDGDAGRLSEIDKQIREIESKITGYENEIKEVEAKLDQLKDEIFITDEPSKVIECQNEIENYNVKLNDLNEILNSLISENTPLMIEKEYLIAKNNDYDLNIPNYNKEDISKDLDRLSRVFENAINKLDLPIRENIEFCQKKITNRELEIDKFTERKNNVMNAYPNAISLNIDSALADLKDLLLDLNLNGSKNVKKEEVKEIKPKEKKEKVEKDIKEEISLFEEDNEIKPLEEKQEEIKEPVEEPKKDIDISKEEIEIKEGPKEEIKETNEDTKEVAKEEKTQEVETNKNDVETKEEDKDEEIGSVSYVLSEGESLANIAEKVYPSKDNWEAIYYFNKDSIDKYLVSNGISNDFDTIKTLAEDTSLFTGIKLEIPTDYNYKI